MEFIKEPPDGGILAGMAVAVQPLTLEQFREQYPDNLKPHFEYWNGEPRQKAMPTKLHARLQKLIAFILADLGYYTFTELTLRIDPNWEPVPDVAGTVDDIPGAYPVKPVDIVVEILSPPDSFSILEAKCERYAALGVADVLVFDPVSRKVWRWDRNVSSLVRVLDASIRLRALDAELDMNSVWSRFETER